MKMQNDQNNDTPIVPIEVSDVSPHSKALYEAGKSILVESLNTGKDFCKSMISTSTAAIPVYLGILTFLFPENYRLGISAGIVVTIPAISFLLSCVLFTIGYLPITGRFSLDLVDEIEKERSSMIKRRNFFIWTGFSTFTFGTLLAIYVIIINIGVR